MTSSPMSRRRSRSLAVFLATCAVALVAAPAALAAPANDDFAAATPIAALPFTSSTDSTGSTTEPGEPQFCSFVSNSLWYAITPTADGVISADTTGSAPFSQLSAYREDGSGLAGLSFLGCQNFGSQAAVLHVTAGQTYYLQASFVFGSGAVLQVNVKAVVPPANDNFADATPITSTPYADDPDLSAASLETGEPTNCTGFGGHTVWYAFTSAVTDSYEVSGAGAVGVYTGPSVSSLTQVACSQFSPAIFRAQAGATYYVQLSNSFLGSGPTQISLTVAPPANAMFFYSPFDPSLFDTVQFYDAAFDPAGLASEAWNFGDGATATDCCPRHRFGADGDYAVKLSIATNDGRTASATQTVQVRTHDVAIAKLGVPSSARVGQSRQLTVGVSNTRYPETVEVTLLRSVAGGGFEPVGQVTNPVPVRSGGHTTPFSVSYTFAPADATARKVTFEAMATIITARDANPADNTVVALATKVDGK